MAFVVHIKQLSSGIVRREIVDLDWEADSQEFMWTEGNYSCDCNRALFWSRAGGEEDIEQDCGNVTYPIRATDDAGKVLFQDSHWDIH